MEGKVCPDRTLLLKKAKWAIRKSYWLNSSLPVEYHSILINQECCSEYCMRICLQNCSLSSETEVLLFDKYEADKPDILKEYISKHGASDDLLIKIIECKNLELLKCFIDLRISLYFRSDSILPQKVQQELIKSNDSIFFKKVLHFGVLLNFSVILDLLQLGNYDMIEVYCQSGFKNKTGSYLYDNWFSMLAQRDDIKSLTLICYYFKLPCSALLKLLEMKHCDFVMEYFKTQTIDEKVQYHIVQSQNKKLIALYISAKPFVKKAQIELVKSGFKDLLKMHYLKYGLDDEAVVFQASLNNVKAYLGV